MAINPMFIGPNQYVIDKYVASILPQSVFFFDPFNGASFGGTPANNAPISSFKEMYGRTTWDLTQPTAASQPLYQTNGGKPYILFDGVDDVLFTASTINSSTYFSSNAVTIIMALIITNLTANGNVIKYCGGTTAARLIGVDLAGSKANWRSTAGQTSLSSYNTLKILGGVRATGTNTKKIYTNGLLEGTQNCVDLVQATDSLFYGAFRNSAPYSEFFGGIGELIVFNTALTDYQIYMISRYFMQRRGL